MALPVDRAQSNAMNLQVLKRQDDTVMDIVDMASHVVVYEFDQSNQSWKRKDVEGCLFVVKRYSSPRFQIFVNNRLSTTNMTIPVNESLEVDSVDTFLILRSPDVAAVGGFAIYGLWFFPEDDREKILKLLQRMVQSLKETGEVTTPTASNTAPKPKATQPQLQQPQPVLQAQAPVLAQAQQQQQTQPAPKQQRQPKQKQQQQQTAGQGQQQQQQPQQGGRGGRARGKRDSDASTSQKSKPTTPTTILQRPGKQGDAGAPESTAPPPTTGYLGNADGYVRNQVTTQEPMAQLQPQSVLGGYTPISREEGIAAGNAILGMLSQAPPQLAQQPPLPKSTGGPPPGMGLLSQQQQQLAARSGGIVGSGSIIVSKEQLKQTLIALLDEPQFFDQIYHAYVGRVHAARS